MDLDVRVHFAMLLRCAEELSIVVIHPFSVHKFKDLMLVTKRRENRVEFLKVIFFKSHKGCEIKVKTLNIDIIEELGRIDSVTFIL